MSTVVSNNANDYEIVLAEKVKTKFVAAIHKSQTEHKEAIVVTAIAASEEVRQEAIAQGVSTGKKAVQILTQNKQKSTSDEELKEKSIEQMITENGGIDKIVPKNHKVSRAEYKSMQNSSRGNNDDDDDHSNIRQDKDKRNKQKIEKEGRGR